MASSLDVYAPCPCGSGKKVKFCCNNALLEMDRVSRLHEKHQPQQALDALTKMGKDHPTAPIIPITRAQLLMEQQRFDEAATEMREFVKVHTEIGHGHALLAMAQFMDVGFHEAKPEIHRAFQVCVQTSPEIISSLAMHIADDLLRSNPMAAREHLGLALRLAKDQQDRTALFQQLMKLDSAPEIPFPLRGTHHLEKVEPPEGSEKDLKNAYRMSMHGCWEIAGKLFLKVSEKLPNDWCVWKNVGLCRSWDDDSAGAAEALHKAAEFAPDFESAVECETMAQLVELESVEKKVPVKATRLRLKSTSKALSVLDEIPRCVRLRADQKEMQGIEIVGRYYFLQFAPPTDGEAINDSNVPKVLAEVAIYDVAAGDEQHGMMSIMAVDGPGRDEAVQVLESTLKDDLLAFEVHQHDHDGGHDCGHDHDSTEPQYRNETVVREVLEELVPVQEREYYGNRLTIAQRRDRFRNESNQFVRTKWCNTPLQRLGGRTPKEAVADQSLRVKLCAALHSLEAIDYGSTFYVDFNDVRRELGIEPQQSATVNDETINALTVMQSHRLPLQELSSEQLSHVLQRAMLVRHVPFTFAVMKEISSRGLEHLKGISVQQFCRTMTEVARELGHHEDAVTWCKRGREDADQGDDFRAKLDWTTREFETRMEDTKDPELASVIDRLWNYFGVKIPALREQLEPVLKELGLPIPGTTASGLVLPESMTVGASGTGESKLWLPGT